MRRIPFNFSVSFLVIAGLVLGVSAQAATVRVSGTLTTSTTWVAANVYVVDNSYTVASGATLTIASGTVVKFNASSSYIDVAGTLKSNGAATKKITFTSIDDSSVGGNIGSSTHPFAGDWGTIQFDPGSSSTLAYTVARYGGGQGYTANLTVTGGNVTLTNAQVGTSTTYGMNISGGRLFVVSSTFNNNPYYGLYEFNSTGTLTLTTSTFSKNVQGAAYFDINKGFSFIPSGNTSNGTSSGFLMTGTLINATTTWYKDLPYILQGNVYASGTLTLNAGTVIKSAAGSGVLYVSAGGTLIANGTSGNPVYFTSLTDDSVGGDTNGDGTATTPQKGDSSYIELDAGASSTLAYTTVRYSGSTYGIWSNIYETGGNLTVSNITVASSSGYGFKLTGGNLAISSSTLNNNSTYGLYALNSATGTLTVTNSTFANNGNRDAYLDLQGGLTLLPSGNNATGTTSTGSGIHGFTIATGGSGGLPINTTILKDLAYVVSAFFSMASGTTLTVNHGAVVKFDTANSAIDIPVNGTFNVQGTAADNAYFTALDDDSVGGDTNADGTSTSAKPGDGGYIQDEPGSGSTIAYASMSYGGAFPGYSNINQLGGNLNISNSRLASSSDYGLYAGGGAVTLQTSEIFSNSPYGIYVASGTLNMTNSNIHNNGSYGLYNATNVTSSASAEFDYWGSSFGPYNANSNPLTYGSTVTDYVDFANWLTTPPVPVTSTQFFAQITNTTNGRWLLRSTPATSTDGNWVERLPEDWVVKVSSTVSSTGTPVVSGGYMWYDVVDPTDGVEGWMAATSSSATYLSYVASSQSDFNATSNVPITSSSNPSRATTILNAIDHFYNDNSTSSLSLYSSEVAGNDIALLKTRGYPKEILWGIAAQESGIPLDNKVVSYDYGHGVMQLTFDAYSSSTPNQPATYDNRGVGSYVTMYPCPSVGTTTYTNCYTNGGATSTTSKPYSHYANVTSSPIYEEYDNTNQSIYANIKDGMRVLQNDFNSYLPNQITTSTTVGTTTYSGVQRETILATEYYNGACGYVDNVASKMDAINAYFPGTSSSTVSSTVQRMHIAGTDMICAQLHSPGELSVEDSQGRTVGVVDGVGRNDFPLAVYDPVHKWVKILAATPDNYVIKVDGTDVGVYGLDVTVKHGSHSGTFHADEIVPIAPNQIDTYTINDEALFAGKRAVTLRVDERGDGIIKKTITIGNVLKRSDLQGDASDSGSTKDTPPLP